MRREEKEKVAEKFVKMGKEELKDKCKEMRLPVGGNMAELRARLERATFRKMTMSLTSTRRPREGGGGGMGKRDGRGQDGRLGLQALT